MPGAKKAYKILVVDDDKITRATVASVFKEKRFSVIQSSGGEMALEILHEVMPDLIFLDIHMQGISGLEVLKRIRSDKDLKYIKIILLSGGSDVNERLKGYELGADDYMTKPFTGGELLAKAEVFMRMTYIEEKNVSLAELVQKELEKHKKQEEYMLTQAKLISMGDMVFAIAHYWRQPLNALGIAVQDIQDAFQHNELTQEYLKKSVDNSMLYISFMSEIIDNFQKMITDDKADTLFNVNYAVKNAVMLVKDRLASVGMELSINGLPYEEYFNDSSVNYYVQGRDWILKQAISSLMHGAVDSSLARRLETGDEKNGYNIKLKIWNVGSMINISVSNDGKTLEEGELDRIFEPYYKTAERIEGRSGGLDLYFSRTLIEKQLSGKIYAVNRDNKTIFFIEVPCVYEEV